MVGMMPVLGKDHGFEFFGQAVDKRHDGIPTLYRERAAGAEIVLQVDDQ